MKKPGRIQARALLAGDIARQLFAIVSKTQKDNIDILLPLILHTNLTDEERNAIAKVIENDLHLNRAFEQLQMGEYQEAETILKTKLFKS